MNTPTFKYDFLCQARQISKIESGVKWKGAISSNH